MTDPKRKRQKPRQYDAVAIPLRDGSFGLAELVGTGGTGDKLLVLFRWRDSSPDRLRDHVQRLEASDVIGLAPVCTLEIERGEWRIVGHDASSGGHLDGLPKFDERTSYTGEIIEGFLEAFHSLRAWNDSRMAPKWFRAILLPQLEPPPQGSRLAPGGAQVALGSNPNVQMESLSPAAGPAQVHVTITYDGGGLPDVALLRKRQSVEAWIEAENLGEVTDAGAGGGIMDIFVEAPNARKTVAALTAKIREMGWGGCAKIEVETRDEPN